MPIRGMYVTMRTVIYARVSTIDQSCEMQLRELREYAQRRGLEIVGEYVDTGWSGAKTSRPELDRLMRAARLRRFDAVLVWKLDRWGRSVGHCIRSVQELVALGIRFLAATQNIDTDESNPTSQFILHIFAAVAELERDMIRERVVSGIRTARQREETGATSENLPPRRSFGNADRGGQLAKNSSRTWRPGVHRH